MRTALLVDDSEFMRELMKAIISAHNIEVVGEADNGQTGVEMYKKLNPDLAFLDVMMDDMDGVEALKQIKNYNPDAIVIVVSSMMKQKPYVDEVLAAGATAIINKPLEKKEVGDVINKLNSMIAP